jgi:hypothetical protein
MRSVHVSKSIRNRPPQKAAAQEINMLTYSRTKRPSEMRACSRAVQIRGCRDYWNAQMIANEPSIIPRPHANAFNLVPLSRNKASPDLVGAVFSLTPLRVLSNATKLEAKTTNPANPAKYTPVGKGRPIQIQRLLIGPTLPDGCPGQIRPARSALRQPPTGAVFAASCLQRTPARPMFAQSLSEIKICDRCSSESATPPTTRRRLRVKTTIDGCAWKRREPSGRIAFCSNSSSERSGARTTEWWFVLADLVVCRPIRILYRIGSQSIRKVGGARFRRRFWDSGSEPRLSRPQSLSQSGISNFWSRAPLVPISHLEEPRLKTWPKRTRIGLSHRAAAVGATAIRKKQTLSCLLPSMGSFRAMTEGLGGRNRLTPTALTATRSPALRLSSRRPPRFSRTVGQGTLPLQSDRQTADLIDDRAGEQCSHLCFVRPTWLAL